MSPSRPPTPEPLRRRRSTGARAGATALVASGLLSGCALVSTPRPAAVQGAPLAPSGAVGYVVCPGAVTPVELDTATSEATIHLPISGTPVLGDYAIATSSDGRWAYVVTADGTTAGASPTTPAASTTPTPAASVTTATPAASSTTAAPAAASTTSTSAPSMAAGGPPGGRDVVVPVDLLTQRAAPPIALPGNGATHAIVVLPGGRTALAASGTTIVPVDTTTRTVGTPIELGAGQTVFGMALSANGATVYALVPGGVVPVDTATGQVGAVIATGLTVSSVYSPHGIVLSPDGSRLYVVGQSGSNFGGRVLPIVTTTGAPLPEASFDKFGIADPAAVAVTADGGTLLVADAANNWVNLVDVADIANPVLPARLPEQSGTADTGGTQHPSDIVVGPGDTGAFLVDGNSSVIPFAPSTQVFGPPIRVCSGATSMAVGPTP